jgi:hypothetical protein
MVAEDDPSVTEDEELEATVVCALPRGARTPRLVTANSMGTNWRIFICNSLLAQNFQIAIEDGGSERPERNQDP